MNESDVMEAEDRKQSLVWTERLKAFAPIFRMSGDNIRVIENPQDFYSTLKERISGAKTRITLASLYLGTGELEKNLVSSVQQALDSSPVALEVRILLDYSRGSRGTQNSRTTLLPLLRRSDFDGKESRLNHRVGVSLYHTPDLRGLLRRLIPERWNETIGLSHMKVYLVDDSVIISGANLSHDYFTNRQDRYILFDDPQLADFFHGLVNTVASFSLQLQPDNTVCLANDWNIHPYQGDRSLFKDKANRRVRSFIDSWSEGNPRSRSYQGVAVPPDAPVSSSQDSAVFPLIQMSPLGITDDARTTESIFRTAGQSSRVLLASGYFNLTSRYVDLILNSSKAEYEILTAAPKANGFFGAKGVSGSIPTAYTYISKLFYERVMCLQDSSRIRLFEYDRRPGWTFHAKGLWLCSTDVALPRMTLVGSPNFGHRSVYRDLEAQVAVVTDNVSLRKQLYREQQLLFEMSSIVSSQTFLNPERYVPIWARLFTKVFKNFF